MKSMIVTRMCLIAVGLLLSLMSPAQASLKASFLPSAAAVTPSNVAKVPVDIYVMSKCPDAVYCEGFLAPVLQELQQHITLQLHYIGQQQRDGHWTCKHGKSECAGDVQQLCVQKNTKVYNRVKWLLAFVLCNNREGLEAIGSFTTASRCLQDAHIPLSAATKMLGCMYGPTHDTDLQTDFQATAASGISTSCTVQFAGATAAVRDGGRWVQAPGDAKPGDFKEHLCSAYAALNRGRLPPPCKAREAREV